MLGAIVGDIVGSRFELYRLQSKDFEWFASSSRFTDDTVLTLALCQAFLDCKGDYGKLPECAQNALRAFVLQYPRAGYGAKFLFWALSDHPQPYGSIGNGCAMRVSPCAVVAKSVAEVKCFSHAVTGLTHNHPESFKAAEAVAVACFLARAGMSKKAIEGVIKKDYYPIDFTIDGIRSSYRFGHSCLQTVPYAIEAFFESESFEETIELAVSLGGDTDTLAAMAGSIAGCYYGVPEAISEAARSYLDDNLRTVLDSFEETFMGP